MKFTHITIVGRVGVRSSVLLALYGLDVDELVLELDEDGLDELGVVAHALHHHAVVQARWTWHAVLLEVLVAGAETILLE